MKILSVGAEMFHADGQTQVTKVLGSFCTILGRHVQKTHACDTLANKYGIGVAGGRWVKAT